MNKQLPVSAKLTVIQGSSLAVQMLTLQHQDAHMVRAVLEGVAYSLRDSLEIFRALASKRRRSFFPAAERNQIIADILDQEAYNSSMQEQACVGTALVAGVWANRGASLCRCSQNQRSSD